MLFLRKKKKEQRKVTERARKQHWNNQIGYPWVFLNRYTFFTLKKIIILYYINFSLLNFFLQDNSPKTKY